ncbi:MAG: DUF2510 domain-containing protein [Actinomycetota bacterium]
MSNTEGTPVVVPGWYADYENPQRLRWWDGTQWTEHVSDPAPAQYSAVQTTPLPATARLGNVFIWIIVFLPLLAIVQLLLTDYTAIAHASLAAPSGSGVEGIGVYSAPGTLLATLLSYVVAAAAIVLAFFDWRSLKRVGVDRPFHWAWAFFAVIGLGIVYVIGRSVVVHRRSGRGLAPLWVHIGIAVVYLVVVVVKVSQMVSYVFANLPNIPTT